MLVKLSTDKTVSEAAAALQATVQANHFGVMQVHNLKETMTKKGVEFGLGYYLARTERMTASQFQQMVNRESGLLGVSGTSSDVRDLLALESRDARAADAVALFCYQAKKWIGSFAAALGGLDTLVFSGGIGENNRSIRARICEGLGFLGIELNEGRNTENASLISTGGGRVAAPGDCPKCGMKLVEKH